MQYDEQVVIAFIDGRKVLYKGMEISDQNANVQAFLKDDTVSQEEKETFKVQYGERPKAESLHDKNAANSRLVLVDDYVPNTKRQAERLIEELAKIPELASNSRVYTVAHCDPDSCRMAGLDPRALADSLLGLADSSISEGRLSRPSSRYSSRTSRAVSSEKSAVPQDVPARTGIA